MKTPKTPHLPTWLFTEKTGFRRGFPGLVKPQKTSPDLESICAPVAEWVTQKEGRKAPLPKGIGDTLGKGLIDGRNKLGPKGPAAERHW